MGQVSVLVLITIGEKYDANSRNCHCIRCSALCFLARASRALVSAFRSQNGYSPRNQRTKSILRMPTRLVRP